MEFSDEDFKKLNAATWLEHQVNKINALNKQIASVQRDYFLMMAEFLQERTAEQVPFLLNRDNKVPLDKIKEVFSALRESCTSVFNDIDKVISDMEEDIDHPEGHE